MKLEERRRLNVLCKNLEDFYRTHKPIKFNMKCFAREVYDDDQGTCLTACCVAGFAGMIPEFKELGL